MKKLKFLFAALIVLVIPSVLLAQDSTSVSGGGTVSIAQTVISFFAGKYPVIGIVGTILFFVSEALASIKGIAANSVFQLVKSVFTIFKKP